MDDLFFIYNRSRVPSMSYRRSSQYVQSNYISTAWLHILINCLHAILHPIQNDMKKLSLNKNKILMRYSTLIFHLSDY